MASLVRRVYIRHHSSHTFPSATPHLRISHPLLSPDHHSSPVASRTPQYHQPDDVTKARELKSGRVFAQDVRKNIHGLNEVE